MTVPAELIKICSRELAFTSRKGGLWLRSICLGMLPISRITRLNMVSISTTSGILLKHTVFDKLGKLIFTLKKLAADLSIFI